MMRNVYLGVIGASSCNDKVAKVAEEVGKEIARAGAILVCGGLGGTMEAACKGAKQAGGTTIGILPSWSRESANEFVDYPIVTGLGDMRNLMVVKNSDAVIALFGRYGTLSEVAFCLNSNTPLVSLSNWNVSKKMIRAKDPEQAVKLALAEIEKLNG
jgi:uncharacterized protein (TIGR00725 family)